MIPADGHIEPSKHAQLYIFIKLPAKPPKIIFKYSSVCALYKIRYETLCKTPYYKTLYETINHPIKITGINK